MKLVLPTTLKTKNALIDSGATENFLDPRTVSRLRLPTTTLEKPRAVHNIDGTHNQGGHILQKCMLKVQLGDNEQEMDFFITNLGQDRAVLGHPFLKTFNPNIDWKKGICREDSLVKIIPRYLATHYWKVYKADGRQTWKMDWPANVHLRKVTFAQQWAAKADEQKEKLKEEDVPKAYQHHWEVFFESKAERLPPNREEDMEIPFKDNAPQQLDCKVYPLTAKELGILKKTIEEDVAKGYIKHGTSSYVSPIFFIPKKDGNELQMVIDYRKLNDITKKDFYPLPNLRTELKKLSQHQLFSKFDVRAGYNNIRIAQKDQYKAAFKTPLGTFVPTVMTFGFCNAPSIFQRAMNRDLAPLKQKYPDNFSNYMDDVAIGTNNTPEGKDLHQKIVNEFLALLEHHSYFLKVSKCEFEKSSIEFLGFKIGNGTVQVEPSKLGGIANWPRELSLVRQVRQILGVLGYQRAFIQDYAHLARPLYDLLQKDVKFEWTEKCRNALDSLIKAITDEPVLLHLTKLNPSNWRRMLPTMVLEQYYSKETNEARDMLLVML